MLNIKRIANLGDSVPWGQGLVEADKYDVAVGDTLGAADLQRLAHSGATIGTVVIESGPAAGEVLVSRPSILDQCNNFAASPDTVDLVLVNGGINDVDIRNILNPLIPAPFLSAMTKDACHDSMLILLQAVAQQFKSAQRIVVTGYYPILSDQSHLPSILDLLGVHGIATPAFVSDKIVIDAVIAHCQQFFRESTAALTQAVKDAGDQRIVFVDSGFTNANAVFAPQPLLWGLNDDLDLSPEDEVVSQRRASCDLAFDKFNILEREQCYRASAGHPNVAGAKQFAKQILAVL